MTADFQYMKEYLRVEAIDFFLSVYVCVRKRDRIALQHVGH